jgi:hypothetical protein
VIGVLVVLQTISVLVVLQTISNNMSVVSDTSPTVSPAPRSESTPSDGSSDESSGDERPKGLIHLRRADAKKYLVGKYHVVVLCKGDAEYNIIHQNWLLSTETDDKGQPIYNRCAYPLGKSGVGLREVTNHPQSFQAGEPFKVYDLVHCPNPAKDYFERKLSSSVEAAS